jgi:3-hydroxyacyl-CoA dehydrogenase/enoyl-CoA hydratase/3-hydroxybutyryl-CoA epimerase
MGFMYEKDDDGIVTVIMDMEGQSANTMTPLYHLLMGQTVSRLEAETGLRGVVFASAKKTFFAGGDLNGLLAMDAADAAYLAWLEEDKGYLRRLERLPVPIVAAINGAALGGGYEICLACNHRLLLEHASAVVGLPEVTLGLLPGAGGVVRLTNLLGLKGALPHLLYGEQVPPRAAFDHGMVDALCARREDLIPSAKAWILANPHSHTQPWDSPLFEPRYDLHCVEAVVTAARNALLQRSHRVSAAAERILDVAAEAIRLPLDAALHYESVQFCTLIGTVATKAAISTFFAKKAIRSKKLRLLDPNIPVESVTALGKDEQ